MSDGKKNNILGKRPIILILRCVIELALAAVSAVGIIQSHNGSDFMGGMTTFLFFAVQSNITISLVCLVFFIDNIIKLFGGRGFVGKALMMTKYVFTVAITITFLVFFVALAPLLPTEYLLSFKNLSLHLIVPLLALCDFFVFDTDIRLNAKNCLFGLFMPLYYLIFFLIGIPLGFRYLGGDNVAPYFFLDYKTYGWLKISKNGIGVVYWCLIMLVFIAGLCCLFLLLTRLRDKRKSASYDEPLRPQFHFTAPKSWLNDPNGLVYFDGLYHLYYQSIPYSSINNGDLHWGHATSPDLIHWTHRAPALSPDKVGTMWSGTAAVDRGGMTGFFSGKKGIVAAYSTDTQNIGIAYSRDGGETFKKVSKTAPVLAHPDGVKDFRDPHIFYYPEDKKWKMAVAGGLLRIYESDDLIKWTPCGDAQEEYSTECPNLIRMKVEETNEEKWVLSLGGRDYVVGSFDGGKFTGETEKTVMDDGADTYAGITFSDTPDGRVIMISWLNRWWYAKLTPDGAWNGAFALPVEMKLHSIGGTYRLFQTPVKEAETLRRELLFSSAGAEIKAGENPIANVFADTFEMLFDVDISRSSAFEIGLRIGEGDRSFIRFDPETMLFTFDRTACAGGSDELKTKFNPREFTVEKGAVTDGKLTFRILVDRSSVEAFIGGGYHYFVARIQPSINSTGMFISAFDTLYADRIEIYKLGSIWKK